MPIRPIHRLSRPAALAAVAVLAAGLVVAADGSPIAAQAGAPTAAAPTAVAELSPTPSPTPAPTPTAEPTPSPSPLTVAATTNGVPVPWADADKATRKPIAVMLDDHWSARPQAGLSEADVVYQALAEGGIPRYMALFQTSDPVLIGPIRSARPYFVAWAEEWNAMYVHFGGSRTALDMLRADDRKYLWNADGMRWTSKGRYVWRVTWRRAPYNCYSDGAHLRSLLVRLGVSGPSPATPWTFGEPEPLQLHPVGGTIVVPYRYNRIEYAYDRATNTYPRSVTANVTRHTMAAQIDPNTGRQVSPSVVVVMYVPTGLMPGDAGKAGRLDLGYVGKGKALVFQNGTAIGARWNKAREHSRTTITYSSGPDAGKPVPFVRGQIFIQIVPTGTAVTYTLGTTPAAPRAGPAE